MAAALLEEGEDKTMGKEVLLADGQNKRHTPAVGMRLCVYNIIRCGVGKA